MAFLTIVGAIPGGLYFVFPMILPTDIGRGMDFNTHAFKSAFFVAAGMYIGNYLENT